VEDRSPQGHSCQDRRSQDRRSDDLGARERLLRRAVDHVAANGLGQLSLRQLATEIGTSHRMLIYHFGSKEGLLAEVAAEVEERQRRTLAGLERELAEHAGPGELLRHFWHRLAEPALRPHEQLFFRLYADSLAGDRRLSGFAERTVLAWLDPLAESARRRGLPPDRARAQARLGLAVVRGLLLDLLATGDRAGVDAALDEFAGTL